MQPGAPRAIAFLPTCGSRLLAIRNYDDTTDWSALGQDFAPHAKPPTITKSHEHVFLQALVHKGAGKKK